MDQTQERASTIYLLQLGQRILACTLDAIQNNDCNYWIWIFFHLLTGPLSYICYTQGINW